MVEVVATDEFVDWFAELREEEQDTVRDAVEILEAKGVSLGYPRSSDIKGSRYAICELRVQAKGVPLRIFYAFDPRRNAVLILGGDKTGNSRFYEVMVPKAERIWEQYLAEQVAGLHDREDEP